MRSDSNVRAAHWQNPTIRLAGFDVQGHRALRRDVASFFMVRPQQRRHL